MLVAPEHCTVRTSVENQVAQIRTARGLSASQLAVLVGVRRQTIYAIESGIYVPNTAVALKLARGSSPSRYTSCSRSNGSGALYGER